MESKDVFITDYEIDAAVDFIRDLPQDADYAMRALTKTLLENEKTGATIAASIVRVLIDPASMPITVSVFYIIGLHAGLARANGKSLEELLGLKEEKK